MIILIIYIVICKVIYLFYVSAAYLCVEPSALVSSILYALTYRDIIASKVLDRLSNKSIIVSKASNKPIAISKYRLYYIDIKDTITFTSLRIKEYYDIYY